MKKSNIIIFVIIILVIIAIFGFAIWDANKSLNEMQMNNSEPVQNVEETTTQEEENLNNTQINETNTDTSGNSSVNTTNYVGDWYISEEAYFNAELIDEILDRREDNLITDAEFEEQMNSDINTSIVKLDVESYSQGIIRFDFELTSPAPTQREAKLEDMMVNITDGVGTFSYTDNWGTSGNGTITLGENSISLKLETTSAAEGALWGVEGTYNFSYKRID